MKKKISHRVLEKKCLLLKGMYRYRAIILCCSVFQFHIPEVQNVCCSKACICKEQLFYVSSFCCFPIPEVLKAAFTP